MERTQSQEAFLEVFIDEVERQLDRKVKIVRYDICGEFYGKFDENEQRLGGYLQSYLKVIVLVHNLADISYFGFYLILSVCKF